MTKIFISIVLLLICLTGLTQNVPLKTAQTVATNWYQHYAPANKQQGSISKTVEYKLKEAINFYIFSFDKGGFVMVSANNQAEPILGYGFEGNVPDKIDNPEVKYWLDGYARQIDTLNTINLKSATINPKWENLEQGIFLKSTSKIIEPLLKTKWDQGWPYNAMCPEDPGGPGGHTLTGCVATAVGQILKYHNYPDKGNGFFTYTDDMSHTVTANFGETNYDWNKMPVYLSPTDTSYNAIAELLYHCGVGSYSNYSNTATAGRMMSEELLLSVFGVAYSSIKRFYRSSLTKIQWDSILINELIENRPIYYEGSNPSLAHSFVCDGYDITGYFHFNFGWSGQADGYYQSGNINPGIFTLNDNQNIIIGIKPNDGTNILGESIYSGIKHLTTSHYVSAFSKLTLNSGTDLLIDPRCTLKIAGSVISNGTALEPVTIGASDTIAGWDGIKIFPSFYQYIMLKEPNQLVFNYTNISNSKMSGIHVEWPSYAKFYDQVIEKGLMLNNVKLFKNTGYAVSGHLAGIRADSCQMYKNGGGISLFLGWINISNSIIQYNSGSGIDFSNQLDYFWKPSIIKNNIISHNTNITDNKVGGISFYPGSYHLVGPYGPLSVIKGNVISYNEGSMAGGILAERNVIIEKNKIFNNFSLFYGSGVIITGGVSLINNEIFNNTTNFIGGGSIAFEQVKIVNNLIYNNNSGLVGVYTVDALLINNTILNNGSGISFMGSGKISVLNSILWNQGVEINGGSNQVQVSHNIIKGGYANINSKNPLSKIDNIINRKPKFVASASFIGNGDLLAGINMELQLNSPAIDAAIKDTSGFNLPLEDIYGHRRIKRVLDIGASENQSDTIYPGFLEDSFTVSGCLGGPLVLKIPYRGINCQFEWFRDDSKKLDVTTDSLFFESLTLSDIGKYFCIISNIYGKDTSDFCVVRAYSTLPVNSPPIIGPDTLYHFQRKVIFSIPKIANANEVYWKTSPGLITELLSDTSIYISVIDTVKSGYLKAIFHNPCGSDTIKKDLSIFRLPSEVALSGPVYYCAENDYRMNPPEININDSFVYDYIEWKVPSWLQYFEKTRYKIFILEIGKEGVNDTIYARWKKNNYGVGQWTPFPIYIFNSPPASAGTIIGTSSIRAGQNAVFYMIPEIANASSYIWNLPPGATGTSSTNNITVNYGNDAVSGNIKVKGHNDCGDGPESSLAIIVNPVTNQDISFNIGWNIISSMVVPTNLDLKTIFQPLIDAGKLKKIMDENGKTIENFGGFGGWVNYIGNLLPTEGFKVNVTAASTLSFEGTPVQLPFDINLNTGWNIISYPSANAQDAKAVFQALIDAGKLKKVMDESGKTIENFGGFGGWVNNIGNLLPGKGYKVSVTTNCILTIPVNGTKSAVIVPEMLASEHFKLVYIGNGTDHMSINLVNLQASELLEGDEFGIFDGKNCVGSATVGMEQLIADFMSIQASSNDHLSETIDGFINGNPIVLQLYRGGQTSVVELTKISGNELFESNGSLFATINTNEQTDVQTTDISASFKCFPNPFTKEITIEVQNSGKSEVKVEIYNMTGQLIKRLYQGNNTENLVLEWDGSNDSGQKVAPGVYLCKVNGETKQVIFEGGKGKK